ncbi:hypothetical protein [Alkaliphilus oremlandii]|uniref:hypothetical protein n=1 Tax=Alkaliphilus oremlandii TaxID=461876 RepID=UPI0012E9F853|nr:hypothetical protein [Alkaliphilus oremlandii]
MSDNNATFYKLCALSFLIIVASILTKFFDRVKVIQYFAYILMTFNIYNLLKNRK